MLNSSFVERIVGRCFESIIIASTSVALLFSAVEGADTGNLRGQVRDADTGEPVGWVLLVVEGFDRACSADAEGRFAFQDLSAGDYIL